MTIWLLALILMASLAALGYRQGAVRVAFSLVGILVGVLLAGWLGRLIKPLLSGVGLKNPILVWALAPFIIFVVVSAIFKVAAFTVHHKIDVYFKYKAGDLRLALWERLNRRLGLCLGLVNGAIYFILLSFVIYSFGYWTVQMASPEGDPKPVAILNRLAEDLDSSGFVRVASAIDPLPPSYFDIADVIGIFYQNPLTAARLARYPGFLSLAERPEFQAFDNDLEWDKLRAERKPIKDVLDYPKVQGIINNPELLKQVWATVEPDRNDLRQYLETGRSQKYESEPILGHWDFDVGAAMRLWRETKPNISGTEVQKMRKFVSAAFAKTTLVAMPDGQALLKNMPVKPPATGVQNVQGSWKNADGKYQISGSLGELNAQIDKDRLLVKGAWMELAFTRED